jgi:hypothetical protein
MTTSDDLPGDMRRTTFDPDLVERLLDGRLEVDDAPDALAGIAALVRTARSPATAAELIDEPRVLEAMAAAPADASGVPRSGRMQVITQLARTKAAAIVVLSALGVGAVAAAVTANRPNDRGNGAPTSAPIVVTVPETQPTLPDTVPDTTESTTTSMSTTTTTVAAQLAAQAAGAGGGPDATGPAAFGLCTAWEAHQRSGAEPNGVAFQNLDAAAAAAGQTTADYCAGVIAEKTAAGSGAGVQTDTAGGNQRAQNDDHGNGPPADRPGATAPGRGHP